VRLRYGKKKLPALEGGFSTGGFQTLFIELLYGFEGRIFHVRESLAPELVIDVIMDAPEPLCHIVLAFCRIGGHILGQGFTTVFAREHIGKRIKEVTDLLCL
jgi:hypothetical protein